MEVVAATPGGGGVSPFHDHDVREWSRIDSITGALERARLETDSWTANTNNSLHKYGKEVFILVLAVEMNGDIMSPLNVVGLFGCLCGLSGHVIHKLSTAPQRGGGNRRSYDSTHHRKKPYRGNRRKTMALMNYEMLHYNPRVVDSRARTGADGAVHQQARRQLEVFQSQIPGGHLQVIKTRTVSSSRWTSSSTTGNGNVARTSGVTATGQAADGFANKGFEDLKLPVYPLDLTSQKSKASVGRSVSRRPPSRQPRPKETQSPPPDVTNHLRNPHLTAATNLHRVSRLCHQIHDNAVRQAFGGKRSPITSISERQNGDGSASGVEIYEIESSATSSSETKSVNGHTNLTRTKSTSSDDIHQIPERDINGKSVEDLEDLEQLQNWRRTSKVRRSLQFPKQSKTTSNTATSSKPIDLPENSVNVRKIREDLEKGRRLNTALRNNSVDLQALDQILQSISSSSSIDKNSTDDTLDDLENEQLISKPKQKRDSFITVESLKEVKGRLRKTSSPTHDIYKAKQDEEPDDGIVTEDPETSPTVKNRVRSYVYGMEAIINKKPTVLGTGSLESRAKLVNGNNNNRTEDWYNRRKSYGFEHVHGHEEASNSISFKNKNVVESSTDSGICRSAEIVLVPTATRTNNNNCFDERSDSESEPGKCNGYDNKITNGINYGKVKKMTNIFNQDEKNTYYNRNVQDHFGTRANELKSTTITIPIVKNNNVIDLSWDDESSKENKRHSIAVDESKYVTKSNDSKLRRTSLAANDNFSKSDFMDDENGFNNRKKRVEFCKTEVHFAADSGKVNIVETDEKPPPTQNFRRRRRNSGPITGFNEDINKNGLPILHFGDSDFEKTMFGIGDESLDSNDKHLNEIIGNDTESNRLPPNFGVVTVNTSNREQTVEYQEEDRRELNNDNESIRGILKNKPIKPKPYHLGDTIPFIESNSEEENSRWAVKLRPVFKDNTPIWKSTVTVFNSYYDKQDVTKEEDSESLKKDQPEFKKLLRNLRPTKRSDYMSDNENRYSDSFSNIQIVSPLRDNRRSSWSVADKVRLSDDGQGNNDHKGYSTKVNFGDGEAIVVESENKDNGHTTWPRSENVANDSKHILNKGLVVRIGRQDSVTKHTVCSKMTTTQDNNNSTTTTKITIDLSPSPPLRGTKKEVPPQFTYAKYQRSHNFKSTSLILNTIKDSNEHRHSYNTPERKNNIVSKALQPLKANDNSSNDSIKSRVSHQSANKIPQQLEALKKLYEDVPSDSDADKEVQLLMSKMTDNELDTVEDSNNSSVVSGSWSKMRAYKNISEVSRSNFKEAKSRFDLKVNAQLEKDSTERLKPTNPITVEAKNNSAFKKFDMLSSRSKLSPVALRKTLPTSNTMTELKTASTMTNEKLSSPSLVGRNVYSNNFESPARLSATTVVTGRVSSAKGRNSPTRSRSKSPVKDRKSDRESPIKEIKDSLLQTNMVLRQPKKSEMTYFGVNLSPQASKKISPSVIKKEISKLSEKPDLLHHHHRNRTPSPNRKAKPRKASPKRSPHRDHSPIYVNQENVKTKKYGVTRDFDSSILDELTKAADQILQAVNGYTDEDCQNRLSSDEDEQKVEPLETISEKKSWKQAHHEAHTKASKAKVTTNVRARVKRTSSTSSVESLSKDRRKVTPTERCKAVSKVTSPTEKPTKSKASTEASSAKANTKARRLQRASSREALLQSHGSSSEDLAGNVDLPVRKPRLVKKTKAVQLTISNGLEFKKPSSRRKEEVVSSKSEECRILNSLPEIRHKTAVSTIRSTAEKCSRDRLRQRNEELKGKTNSKKEIGKSVTSTSRVITRSNNNRSSATTATNPKDTVTHRISTANIKKCHRSEGVPKH